MAVVSENSDETGPRFSLEIPIQSSNNNNNNSSSSIYSDENNDLFIEIFSQELQHIPPSTLLPILEEEKANLSVYNLLAGYYSLYDVKHARQVMEAGLKLVEEDHPRGGKSSHNLKESSHRCAKEEKMRLHGSMGILLTLFSCLAEDSGEVEDVRASAEHYLSSVSKIDMLDPLSQVGKAFLAMTKGDYKGSKFWLTSVQTAAKQKQSRGGLVHVLPAILGIGCTYYYQKEYNRAMEQFENAVRLFGGPRSHPVVFSGILTLYSLTLAKLGQIDRAIYGFERAIYYHKENVTALVSKSVLEMGGVGMDLLAGEEEQKKVNRILQTLSVIEGY